MPKKILYTPRHWALEHIHDRSERWKVIIVHRRGGKTTACINHLIRDAMQINGSRYAYIAPTYKQAKNIAWDILKSHCIDVQGVKFNESELRADFGNGSRITLYGADNPDSLRGVALWGVVFDEYSQQPSNIFSEIIRPALADNKGYALWIGTPKGKNDFYRLFVESHNKKNWYGARLSVEDTGELDDDELEDARITMSEDEYKQEFLCSFEAHIKGSVYKQELEKARKEKRILPIHYDEQLQVVTSWDLGMSDKTSIGFFQKYSNELRLIDYYEGTGHGLKHYIDVINDKGYTYSEHILPHDVKVRELGTGRTRLETLESLGLTNLTVAKNIGIIEGINAVRSIFNRLWIHEGLEEMINALSQYRYDWDDRLGRYRVKPLHDWTSHTADMLRYFAVMEHMLISERRIKSTSQINFIDSSHEVSAY